MNAYLEFKNRKQAEYDAFPMHFAFSQEQLEKAVKEMGLTMKNYEKNIVPIGCGGFIHKKDKEAFVEMVSRLRKEERDLIAADTTGEGFIKDMFLYELRNHEYGYTYDDEDTLEALGITYRDLEKNPALQHGLNAAKMIIAGEEE